MNTFSTLTSLNGDLYQRADRLRVLLVGETFFDREFFCRHVFGACSYLVKGKQPIDPEDRIFQMGPGLSLFRKLHIETWCEWSARDRYIYFVLLMHAWVRLKLAKPEEEIRKIPNELGDFEPTDLGIVAYFMHDLKRQGFPTIGIDFADSFSNCEDVVTRGLAGEIVPSAFAQARLAFEKLEKLFDTLWSDEARCVALRGYLAGIGFCLSWLEIREELLKDVTDALK